MIFLEFITSNEILMSAEVSVNEKIDDEFEQYPEVKDIYVKIKKSNGEKCPRCWRFFDKLKLVKYFVKDVMSLPMIHSC